MKIGIRDGCLQETWATAFGVGAEIGFDGIELDLGASYEETMLWSLEGRERLRQIVSASGVELASLCLGVCWTFSPASDSAGTRERIERVITASCTFAAELGARWILVPVTPGDEGVTHEVGTERWIEMMAKVAPLAADLGIVLCLENVGRGYGKSAADLAHLVDSVGSPGVRVYYDVGNALAFGNDPVAEIGALGSRIAEVHIKDREADLLGEGIVPIPQCLEALREIGYDDWLVLETPPTDDPRAAAAHNLRYLRELLR